MKIRLFQASNGDSLLLQLKDGTNLLVDGGLKGSYEDHVAPAHGRLANRKQAIDLVCVSHIDQDHIAGILKLMDDLASWRVYDFQQASRNARFHRPSAPRPPDIRAVWHNTFKDQIGENSGAIETQLIANARVLHLNERLIGDELSSAAGDYVNLVTSVQESLRLANRLSRNQLKIPVNEPFGGSVILADAGSAAAEAVRVGGFKLLILGPFKRDLEKQREEWNEWLVANEGIVEDIRREAEEEAGLLPMDEGQAVLSFTLQLASELGNRNAVTTPNLASVMLYAEGDGKTVLLTGDGHADDILRGLELRGLLNADGRLHVDVLKVQHHGSEHNLHRAFCEAVTADHYLFCCNGGHHNPALEVLEALIDARLSAEPGTDAARPFQLWFSSSPKFAGTEKREAHMKAVRQLVSGHARRSGRPRRLRYRFLTRGSYLTIRV